MLKKFSSTILLLLALFTAIPDQSYALYGSVKAMGMGNTGIAYPQDALAGVFNPAGMVEVGNRFDLGAVWFHDNGTATIKGNFIPPEAGGPASADGHYNRTKQKDIYGPDFGINKMVSCNTSLGLFFSGNVYDKTSLAKPIFLFGTSKLGLEYLNASISPVISVKPHPCHSFGFALNVMIQRYKIKGEQISRIVSIAPENVTNRGYNYSTGIGFTLGWRWQIRPDLFFGLTYQPETTMQHFQKYQGLVAKRGKINFPQVIGAGLAYHPFDCATVTFDVQHFWLRSIPTAHNSGEFVGTLLGKTNAPGAGLRNSITIYKIGADYKFYDCLTVRAGFLHLRSPNKRSETFADFVHMLNVEDIATAGLTWDLNRCNEFSIAYQHGFYNKIRGRDNGIPINSGGGKVDLKEHFNILAFSWGKKF